MHVPVNNAGAAYADDLADAKWANVEEVIQVNVLAPMRLCRYAVIRMTVQPGGGHLINMSSLAGVAMLPGMAPYAVSKAALSHFTAELRLELAGLLIGTTLVKLGPIPTQMLRDAKKASTDRCRLPAVVQPAPAGRHRSEHRRGRGRRRRSPRTKPCPADGAGREVAGWRWATRPVWARCP
ncbi:MAG TPA: SDR family NAD(P)-dependent oxidoreductase [Frankiaceae bacterium]|nr:SDR family NAD(P)-dependent oxidoreductase [Frankiaceae bacterium]